MPISVYAVKHKDTQVVSASRSGGVFTALSDLVLDQGGVVYGCVLDENLVARHVRADDRSTRDKMRGSKYIQSSLGDSFKLVEADLASGIKVLFTGTSCQVAGLKAYLGRRYDNLLLVDIVCHGVPSPRVWREFVAWHEGRKGQKVVSADFRNKGVFGWAAHKESLFFEDGSRVDDKTFRNLFNSLLVQRPSCYECRYKSVEHPGDITIADYWGIEKAAPEFDDNKGVSLVLINSEAGAAWFESAKAVVTWKATRLEDSMQPSLRGPYPRPDKRDEFWADMDRMKFMGIAKKYGGYGLKNDVVSKIKGFLKKGV